MSFSNLFTSLSTIKEAAAQPARNGTLRNDDKSGKRRRKWKPQSDHNGPEHKKQRFQFQTTRSYHDNARDNQTLNGGREHAGFTRKVPYNYNNMGHKGQNKTTEHKKQQYRQHGNKTEQQGDVYQQKNGWRTSTRGGKHPDSWRKGRNTNNQEDVQVKHSRFMSEEFKEQNGLVVDGQLLCRHFLYGRCNRGDECQLKHVQASNNFIKEVCKFYIQGICTKGETCLYMHKSFPCKFFHRKGNCSQGEDCRFSHEPLDDLTTRLLDEALKRENDLLELAKKLEQEASGQLVNTEEPETMKANEIPDLLLKPLRPNFYNSAAPESHNEAAAEAPVESLPPPPPPPQQQPVCYSVEAVLGSHISKPFLGLFTTPPRQDPPPPSAPYSVDNVLRSSKPPDGSTFSYSPAAQTRSYTPETQRLSSENYKHKVVEITGYEPKKIQEKTLKSHVQHGLISKLFTDNHLRKGSVTSSRDCKPGGSKLLSLFSAPPSFQTSAPGRPALSTSDSKASVDSSSGSVDFKGRNLAAENLNQESENSQSGVKLGAERQYSSKTTKTKTINCGDLIVGRSKSPKTSFRSLFANPLKTESAPPAASGHSSSSTSQSDDLPGEDVHIKPDRSGSSRSFLSLFAAPLPDVPSNPPVDAGLSESEQRSSKLETPQFCKEISNVSPRPKKVIDDRSTEVLNPAAKQQVKTMDSLKSTNQELTQKVAAASGSVLKTLFLSLRPFHKDQEQQDTGHDVSGSAKKEEIRAACDSVEQQLNSKKRKGSRNKKQQQQQTENSQHLSTLNVTQQQPLQPPHIRFNAADPGLVELQVRNSDTHRSPFKSMLQAMQPQTTETLNKVKGNAAFTPLKDLFKSL